MFTGLIETTGKMLSLTRQGNHHKLQIQAPELPAHEIKIGDSIAVNGACLTVEEMAGDVYTFHTLEETLKRTSLGQRQPGQLLNMERALRFGGRLDGHLVSGHIDTTTPIRNIEQTQEDLIVTLELPQHLAAQFIEKGSIAIDGISLTISKLTADSFSVNLIPITWKDTNLFERSVGDLVNIETDVIGKFIQRQLEVWGPNQGNGGQITAQKLADYGFM